MARSQVNRIAAVLVVFVMVFSALAVFAVAPASAGAASFSVRASAGSDRVAMVPSFAAPPHPDTSYAIIFTESGLPAGKLWKVTVGPASSTYTTDGGNDGLSFVDPNGVYAYTITDISGWHQNNLSYHGTITVSGASITEPNLLYFQVNYLVAFSESGLPSGETFQVTLNGSVQSLLTDGATDSVTFSVPNNSVVNPHYAYAIADISGWHQPTLAYHGSITVNGAAVTEPTLAYVEVTYTITFSESGLPSGQTWMVTVGGTPKSLTTNGGTDTLAWPGLPNDTYTYAITDISGWHQGTLPYSGSILVNGASVTKPTLSYSRVTYSVVFSEIGLPSGQTFEVNLGRVGEALTSDGGNDSLLFNDPNGTYSYAIQNVPGWRESTLPYSGSILVNGASVNVVTVEFVQVNYTITFMESTLPSGTVWSVDLSGTVHTSTGPSITFSDPNGTYGYRVGYVAGYSPSVPTGSVTVNGADASATVVFTQVTYGVTFTESGLPSGTSWSVMINAVSLSSTGPSIVFTLPNGTFGYTIGYVSGWIPGVPSGSVPVNGASASVGVAFTQVRYTLTFTETGLPAAGTKVWSVSLDGELQHTTGPSIVFPVANGSHAYLVKGPGGYRVSSVLPPSGSISIAGASLPQSVTFVRGGTGTIVFHEKGLGAGTNWCVVLGSTLCSTTPKIIAKNLTPGLYSYSIGSFHGMTTLVKIGGVAVGTSGTVSVAHATTVQVRYTWPVTFTETGLPGGTSWSVTAGGSLVSSTGPTIVLHLVNGTYSFHIGKVTGYVASPVSGGVRITGAPLGVSVRFTVHTHH
ncbi:MAG: hypothetical protein ACLQD8_02965 [Thermoplasmata archaeon]